MRLHHLPLKVLGAFLLAASILLSISVALASARARAAQHAALGTRPLFPMSGTTAPPRRAVAHATADTRVYVGAAGNGSVTAVDLPAGTTMSSPSFGGFVSGIALLPDGSLLLAADLQGKAVYALSPDDLSVRTSVDLPGSPQSILVRDDGSVAYTANIEGSVSAIHLPDLAVVTQTLG